MNNYNMKKLIRKVILISAISIFLMMLIFSFNDIESIFGALKNANLLYVFYASIFLVLYFALYPLTLCILGKINGTKAKFRDMFLIGSTEHFFNGITPFATGGQPFQVYAFNKVGVKPSESTALLMMNFIIFMMSTNTFALLSLRYYNEFTELIPNIQFVVIIGFTLNFLVLLQFLLMSMSRTVQQLAVKLLTKLCKFKLINKFAGNKIEEFDKYFSDAQAAVKQLFKNKLCFLGCILLKLTTLVCLYIIPFFLLKGLGLDLEADSIFYIIAGTSFALTMVVWVPTPGASGGIELAFQTIFVTLGVTNAEALGGVLLWRLLSYYLLMLISFGAYLSFEKLNPDTSIEENVNEIIEQQNKEEKETTEEGVE